MSFENDITAIKTLIEAGPGVCQRCGEDADRLFDGYCEKCCKTMDRIDRELDQDLTGQDREAYYGENESIMEGLADAKRLYGAEGEKVAGPEGKARIVYPEGKIPMPILMKLAEKDPTYPKKGKYIQWMARVYLAAGRRGIRQFDILREFEDLVSRNQIRNKDINTYRDLEAVQDAINDVVSAKENSRTNLLDIDVLKQIDLTPNWSNPSYEITVGGYEVIIVKRPREDDDNGGLITVKFLNGPQKGKTQNVSETEIGGNTGDLQWENNMVAVVRADTIEKSKLYGRGATWCTTMQADTYFRRYWNSEGNVLYIILPKTPKALMDGSLVKDTRANAQGAVNEDRFKKICVRIEPTDPPTEEGRVAEIRDFYNAMIGAEIWQMLLKMWGLPLEELTWTNRGDLVWV